MRRILLLTITLLVTINFLTSPTVRTQQPEEDKLPDPEDYRTAGANCENRVNVSPWVGTPAVEFTKTARCVLTIHTCEGVKTTTSNPRAIGATVCADYWKVHDALATREICCDKKRPCENPTTNATLPPWLNDGSCARSKSVGLRVAPQKVDEQDRLLAPGEIWCVAEYSVCLNPVVDEIIRVVKKVTIDLAAWNSSISKDYIDATTTACQSFFDEHRNAPKRSICCDKREQTSANPQFATCDRTSDPDCDGIPNSLDPFPLHARSTEYTSNSPLTRFPFWKDFKNATPAEYCECQWELLDARYKCTNVRVHSSASRGSSNQAKYNYQAKWKCAATGREIVTTRQVTMPGVFCPRGRVNG